VELQGRQEDFKAKGAALLVLGSHPETMEAAREQASSHHITYPILYDRETDATRSLGLWSDHMEMPWMGYVILDKSGRIVAGEQQIDESIGSGPRNVDRILAALEKSREATAPASRVLER